MSNRASSLRNANDQNIVANDKHQSGGLPSWLGDWVAAWNQFWFTPQTSETLAAMRWLTGLIVLYSHAVWSIDLNRFMAHDGLLPMNYRSELMPSGGMAWSHFDWFASEGWLWVTHIVGLLVIAAWTIGFQTRWTGWLTAAVVISYANRATGALFGLDQIAAFLCLYLAISHCGDRWSVDAWRRTKNNAELPGQGRAVVNRIATRLIQIHLCVVYLFAGLGKLGGEFWLNGEAVWGALASYEYQSLDMTWLANHMPIVAAMTLVSLIWEVTYAALIWSRLTRPIVLLVAVFVHVGIGAAMGMMTFGLIMLVANLAFVEPTWLSNWSSSRSTNVSRPDSN